jgi:hypothetical protein
LHFPNPYTVVANTRLTLSFLYLSAYAKRSRKGR